MAEPGMEQGRRRRRIPAAEIREQMLDTGRTLALDGGIGLSLEDLSMEEIIQRARVPRSSVYRLWPYKDEFVDDLLIYLAGPERWFAGQGVFDPDTFVLIGQILEKNAPRLATLEGRRAILCEIIRVSVARNFKVLDENLNWRIHIALIATVGSTRRQELRARIATTLEETQSHSRRSMSVAYQHMLQVLGLRLRDEAHTIDHLLTAASSLVQGLALRKALAVAAADDPDNLDAAESVRLLTTPLPGPGLDGELAEWSLVSLAYLALLDAFLEPDPAYGVEQGP